ncbi:gliding motility-associated ABC transporter substrate-binding protein GldG [Aureibaculum sp. 2210JD6-5]|uniref:gliding motility-associated ABC transporter substrate-binding protein GldG n=1 Tax=Aureibaculum sp. 2210JD6-5 TaxID=3103957 RepID=UPI002AADBA25|nr:gliding motility-associated ABC transporter substrate-binding protein GldG [Aureibaculum sp. 2210JD6-5]MDY7396646.1 gliding motility-associated ABC transporter substrate-binding protein GldG [Aureibaculum sp. 2210JD6-5]
MKNDVPKIIILVVTLLAANFLANKFYKRLDLTQDKRYTLSETTVNIVDSLEENAIIKVYLEGDFPSEFKRLQNETRQHLEELYAINNNIKYRFIDPLDTAEELIKQGLQPSRLSVQEDGKLSEAVIFPWATITYKGKTENINLLVDVSVDNQEEQLQNSIENLEFAFTEAIHKVVKEKNQSIAILKGNGELDDIYLASFLSQLNQYYKLGPFTLDSVAKQPQNTLEQLTEYDLTIIAKPEEKFTEEEKFVLDQYITNGGKTLWLIDNVTAELDSLTNTGESLAYNKDLGLTDLLFNYGVRINYDLIRDAYSSTIRLADGNVGNNTQFKDYIWHYHPFITSKNDHPITKGVDPVNLRFANTIDTLKNNIKKTVLLQSSEVSKPVGTPVIVSLADIEKKPEKKDYNNGFQILGVLLEGEFTSAYANRVKPFDTSIFKEKSETNKMVIIADGDIIANELVKGQPIELGVDKYTGVRYGNAEFLMNTINYLLDDSGLLELRNKKIQLQFLDKEKAYTERTFWQLINVVLPLVVLAIFGLIFTFLRKRKYS